MAKPKQNTVARYTPMAASTFFMEVNMEATGLISW